MEIKLAENSTLTVKDHSGNTLCSVDEATSTINGAGTKLYMHHVHDDNNYVDIVTLTSSQFTNYDDVCTVLRLGATGGQGRSQVKHISYDYINHKLVILTQDNYYDPSQDFTYTIESD